MRKTALAMALLMALAAGPAAAQPLVSIDTHDAFFENQRALCGRAFEGKVVEGNGSDDAMTMYGGHTVDAGWASAQAFPADRYSQEVFVAQGIPQSIENTWHLYVYPDRFTYRLTRAGREFRVDFDLTAPVPPPPAPWGAQ